MRFRDVAQTVAPSTIQYNIKLLELWNPPEMAKTSIINVAGIANFQMRANVEINNDNNYTTIRIQVNIYALDINNMYILHLTSAKLNFKRFIRVSDTTKYKWHTVYRNNINYCNKNVFYGGRLDFDLSGELISGVNERNTPHHQRLISMFDEDQTSDVELVGIDSSIRAHGCVLAEASVYMRTAFYGEGDFKERRERRLTLPDVNVAALKLMKQFMYTGYVDVIKDIPTLMMALSLSSLTMIPDFGMACISSLDEFTTEELWSLLHVAFENKHQVLILDIINRLNFTKVNEIRIKLEEQKADENLHEEDGKK